MLIDLQKLSAQPKPIFVMTVILISVSYESSVLPKFLIENTLLILLNSFVMTGFQSPEQSTYFFKLILNYPIMFIRIFLYLLIY